MERESTAHKIISNPAKRALRFLKILAKADVIFYVMPLFMVALVLGTLAQADIGLYAAHKIYFASFVYWLGPLPLPGGYTLMAIITAGLIAKMLAASLWRWHKAGIILTHLGALVLLGGGLLTALTAREGYMLLPENTSSSFVYDYHTREFYIFSQDRLMHALELGQIKSGPLSLAGVPFDIKVDQICENCEIIKREDVPEDDRHLESVKGMAQFMALKSKPPENDPEANLGGMSFQISGLGTEQDGTYIAFEAMPKPIEIEANGKNFKIIMGKQQRKLPFEIFLTDFQKETHPGTEMASAYRSDIVLKDSGLEWPMRIEMNSPLRYKGFTFFQSSFEETPSGDISVLSVVENKGRIFPYLGTLIIAAGLLLHMARGTTYKKSQNT